MRLKEVGLGRWRITIVLMCVSIIAAEKMFGLRNVIKKKFGVQNVDGGAQNRGTNNS